VPEPEPPEPEPHQNFHPEPEPEPHKNDAAPQHCFEIQIFQHFISQTSLIAYIYVKHCLLQKYIFLVHISSLLEFTCKVES
jgi:hypothetical protein